MKETGKPTTAEIFTRAINGHLAGDAFEKLQACRVLVAGLGGGSNVAELLARKGFGTLVVVDPDTYEPSNVRQRQSVASSWGTPKALSVRDRLLDINPNMVVEATHGPLTTENAESFVERVDLVVDMLDFSALREKVALHTAARRQKKYAMTAPSIVNGAACVVFAPDGIPFDDWLSQGEPISPEGVVRRFGERFPDEAPREMFMEAAHGQRAFPLDAVGVDQAAILLTTAGENLVLGRLDRVILAPKYLLVDTSDPRFLGRVVE